DIQRAPRKRKAKRRVEHWNPSEHRDDDLAPHKRSHATTPTEGDGDAAPTPPAAPATLMTFNQAQDLRRRMAQAFGWSQQTKEAATSVRPGREPARYSVEYRAPDGEVIALHSLDDAERLVPGWADEDAEGLAGHLGEDELRQAAAEVEEAERRG